MIDSDIKRSATITSDRMLDCHMIIPLDAVISKKEAWNAAGEFLKIQGTAEDNLELLKKVIISAKSHG